MYGAAWAAAVLAAPSFAAHTLGGDTSEAAPTWVAPTGTTVVARWRSQLELLAAEFAAGDFRVDPVATAQAAGQYAVLTGAYGGEEDGE